MYKIEFCSYTLDTKDHTRHGVLLKITFGDGLIGYSDCHPWPELGDLNLETQLDLLAKGKQSNLLDCSLAFARLDAEARNQKKSLLAHAKIPLSHFLLMDLLQTHPQHIQKVLSQGFTHIKIKMGTNPDEEINKLLLLFSHTPLKLRLDFNEKLSFHTYLHHLKKLNSISSSIDYIEDPFPFEEKTWEQIKKESSIPLACDRKVLQAVSNPNCYSFLIVKPAIISLTTLKEMPKEKMIVTTYLNHPLGQLEAAYVASHCDPSNNQIHGLTSHYTYLPNAFSQELSTQGPFFKVPSGHGFGYDDLLSTCQWKRIL